MQNIFMTNRSLSVTLIEFENSKDTSNNPQTESKFIWVKPEGNCSGRGSYKMTLPNYT